MTAQFKKGTVFDFAWVDFEKCEGFWDCSPRYRVMLHSTDKFVITDCWIDDETGQPRFRFRETSKSPQDSARDWEIDGLLAYFGRILESPNSQGE